MPKPKRNSRPAARPERAAKVAVLPRTRGGVPDIPWIKTLAEPYLRDYQARAVKTGALRGFRFDAPAPAKGQAKFSAGFFVGYLVASREHEFIRPAPPECIVFAFLGPVGSRSHRELVSRDGSFFRKTFEYIGWLTHRPPRFVFLDDQEMALARHFPMSDWPVAKREHYSRNFFIETLAWLVRSGLVAGLRDGVESSPVTV